MSKFNKKTDTNVTVNRSGYPAYTMSDREHLVTSALTSMFGEPKFYGSTDAEIIQLATRCAIQEPEFLAKLACYARKEGNLRSVSHVLTAVIAREASEYTRRVMDQVIVRADDLLEIMACYQNLYGKPFPNALKRGAADAMKKFDEYAFAKYNGGSRNIHFRDVLRITHPVPENAEQEALFGKILSDTLETPVTWETQLSERGNSKEVWEELIAEDRLGYMAMLRNLRNMLTHGVDVTPVLEKLADEKAVLASRQLPFRFFAAYRELVNAGLMTPQVSAALEAALHASVQNLPRMEGKTLLALDCSGSMGFRVSERSTVTCDQIANLLGMLAAQICEDVTVVRFSNSLEPVKIDREKSVLETVSAMQPAWGGTDMHLPLAVANRQRKFFDRIIYFSDNECNCAFGGSRYTVQSDLDEYRRQVNPDVWVHAVDLQGYGTQQFCGERVNVIAGWGDSVLKFIGQVEAGMQTLVQAIQEYPL